jgi:putative phosphoesterase
MRVAALYDIHGNLPALQAVLREVEREAPDAILIGGDAALGPMPGETLERLVGLSGDTRFVRGNTDREMVASYDDGGAVTDDDVWARRTDWAARQITRAQRDLLDSWPETLVIDIDGLGPTLFCHGSPRSDDEVITRVTPPRRLDEMLASTAENVIVCGHTHVQFDRVHEGKRIVNAGSVGMHSEGRPGAYWVLLGPDVEMRRTMYDVERATELIRTSGFPEPDWLVERLTADDPSLAETMSVYRERAAAEEA